MATITVASTTVPNYQRAGSTATVRLYATESFFSDGVEVPSGEQNYQEIACTVASDTVTIPEFTLRSTTDSTVDSARYVAKLFDAQGGYVTTLMNGIEFFLDPVPTSTTWEEIMVANQAVRRTMPDYFYTSNQTDLLLDSKQDVLVSGTTIKTIEGIDVLGTGDIDITKAHVGLSAVDNTADADKPVSTATQTALDAKQDTLVSGTNIKTINSTSLLGSGDLAIIGSGELGSVYFTGNELQHINCGRFWRGDGLYSHFFWEAWVRPDSQQSWAGYFVADTQGGAHCLLWGVQPSTATHCGVTGNVQAYAPAVTVGSVDHAANDTITITDHGLYTGQKVVPTSTGTVPGGLVSGTTYYVIKIDANTIRLASNFNDTQKPSPTYIDLTSAGTGTITLTPTQLTTFSAPDILPYGHDVHLAVGWDGSHIMTWLFGILVSVMPFAPAYRQNGGGNDGNLYLGGSDHSNFWGNIHQVRGLEGPGRCPVQSDFTPELYFRPPFHASNTGGLDTPQFCMSLQQNMGIFPDLGKFEGAPHHGVLEALQATSTEAGSTVGYTLTLPSFQPGETISTGTYTPVAPATPTGAIIWDSFSRPDRHAASPNPDSLLSYYTLGDVEVGGVSWERVDGNPVDSGGGIICGRAFLIHGNSERVVETSTQNVDVRVDRLNEIYQKTGLVVRYKDANDYYSVIADEYTILVTKVEGGVTTTVGYTPVAGWKTLRVVANGTSFEIFTGTATEGTFTSAGSFTGTDVVGATKAGIIRSSIGLKQCFSYDNFLVKAA